MSPSSSTPVRHLLFLVVSGVSPRGLMTGGTGLLCFALLCSACATRFDSFVTPFGRDSVVAAVEALKQGKPIVVTDDEDRENEGDLIMAGELATAETVGFIVRHSSGVICVAVPDER